MRDFVVNNMLDSIKKSNPDYDNEKMEVIEYGLSVLYMFVSKAIIIFTIAYFLGILKELFIFLLIYGSIRAFSFGIHANSSTVCLIVSASSFFLVTYLCIYISIPIIFKIICGILGIINIALFSPADTKKKPIIDKRRRLFYKIISTVIAIVMVVCSVIIKDNFLSNSFLFALIIQCIGISPFTYKLFNQEYNNYRFYISD